MMKKHFVPTAAVLFGVFLICQFLLHHHTVYTSVSTMTYVDQRYRYTYAFVVLDF